MAFFNQMGGGMPGMGMGGGMGGSMGLGGGAPSAFSAPGMDPMTLSLLFRMQNAGSPAAGNPLGMAAPQMPPPPQMGGGGMPPMMGGAPPAAMGPPQGGMMGGIMQMLAGMDPQRLRSMLGMLGGGMGGGAGAGPSSGMPGPGAGGLY